MVLPRIQKLNWYAHDYQQHNSNYNLASQVCGSLSDLKQCILARALLVWQLVL